MKSEAQIQEAHDRLVATLLKEVPNPFKDALSETVMHVAADVLCWVLDHDHNKAFGDNLAQLIQGQDELGVRMQDHGNEHAHCE